MKRNLRLAVSIGLVAVALSWGLLRQLYNADGVAKKKGQSEEIEVSKKADSNSHSPPGNPQVTHERDIHFESRKFYFDSLPEDFDEEIDYSLRSFFEEYYERSPSGAMGWILKRPPKGIFWGGYRELGLQLAKNGDLGKLPKGLDPWKSKVVYDGAIEHLITEDPAEALSFRAMGSSDISLSYLMARATEAGKMNQAINASRTLLSPQESLNAVINLYDHWARKAPLKAAESLAKQQNSKERYYSAQRVGRVWSKRDSEGYHRWLQSESVANQQLFNEAVLGLPFE